MRRIDLGTRGYVQGEPAYTALTEEQWRALRDLKVNILRPETAEQIAAHNRAVRRNCEDRPG